MSNVDRDQFRGMGGPVDTRPVVDVRSTVTTALADIKQDQAMQELGIEFLNPGPKKDKRFINTVASRGSLDLYIPACPDYQGNAEGIGSGVGGSNINILQKLPTFVKFFTSRGIPVTCRVVLADVEALDEFRQQKLGMTQDEILGKIRSSVPSLQSFAENAFASAGISVPLAVETMLEGGYYTEKDDAAGIERADKLNDSALLENFLRMEGLYRRWIPEGAYDPTNPQEFHTYATQRIAKQYVRRFSAFGNNIAERSGVMFTFPTRNNDYYPGLAFVCNK